MFLYLVQHSICTVGNGMSTAGGISETRREHALRWGAAVIAGAIIGLAGAGSALAGQVTGAADNLRTGWYPDEPALKPDMVTTPGLFKEAFKTKIEGQAYAQPLVANGTLLVATEENWVYGLDPFTGKPLWEKHFGQAVTAGKTGEATVECEFPDMKPKVGITGTPVIDTEKNIAYFVSNRYVTGSSGEIAWYMHAINLSNGEEAAHFPVRIEGGATNLPGVKFKPVLSLQRPALLLMNGVVYAGFGSHCDNRPFQGWLVGVTTGGQVVTKWATAKEGASIWQAGGGLISDGEGRIIFSTGNGPGDEAEAFPLPGLGSAPPEGRLADSVVQVEVQSDHSIKPRDYFSPFNNEVLDKEDMDLGSSAPLALPEQFGNAKHRKLLVQSGKEGSVYLLDREALGGTAQGLGSTDAVVQSVGNFGGVWDGAAVWPGEGGYVYMPSVSEGHTDDANGGSLQFFKYEELAKEPHLSLAATTKKAKHFAFGSGSPIVTSDGTKAGSALVWITWCPGEEALPECEGAQLRAYSPVPSTAEEGVVDEKGVLEHVTAFWEAGIGKAEKFSRPVASKGHVYVANAEGDASGFSASETTKQRETHEQEAAKERENAEIKGKEIAEREAPKVTEQPESVTVLEGEEASFEAKGSGVPAPEVQWELSTNGGTTFAPVSGAKADKLTIAKTTASESKDEYRAVFSNGVSPNATTSAVTLTVNQREAPTLTEGPRSVTVFEGEEASFEAKGSGVPAPEVQWELSTNGGATWAPVSGAKADKLTIAKAQASEDKDEFRAVFSNGVSPNATTSAVTLTVTKKPSGGGSGNGGGSSSSSESGNSGGSSSNNLGGGVLGVTTTVAPAVPDASLASASLVVAKSGAVTLKVTCPAGETSCAGTVTLRTVGAVSARATASAKKRILTLTVGSFTVAGGQLKAIILHLSATARKLLAKTHVLRARATIVAHDPAGAAHTTQMTVTLRVAKSGQGNH
jgi:hypothetical protein